MKRIAAAVMIATLAGCATMAAPPLPEQAMPAGWRHADASTPAAEASWPDPSWWSNFGSPELVELIESAEKNNHDLAAAGHRIAQARGNLRVAESASAPTVDLSANAGRAGSDGAQRGQFVPRSLSAGYELDVWGRNRAIGDAAAASLAASGYARETARITVVADTAAAYFQILSLSDRLDTARQQLANAREFLKLLEVQFSAGAVSQLEVERQKNLVASLEASIPPIVQNREQTLDALAVLLGVTPQEVRVKEGSLSDLKLPSLAPGLPADLLMRRPDLRKAEADLVAAGANLAGRTGCDAAAHRSLARQHAAGRYPRRAYGARRARLVAGIGHLPVDLRRRPARGPARRRGRAPQRAHRELPPGDTREPARRRGCARRRSGTSSSSRKRSSARSITRAKPTASPRCAGARALRTSLRCWMPSAA